MTWKNITLAHHALKLHIALPIRFNSNIEGLEISDLRIINTASNSVNLSMCIENMNVTWIGTKHTNYTKTVKSQTIQQQLHLLNFWIIFMFDTSSTLFSSVIFLTQLSKTKNRSYVVIYHRICMFRSLKIRFHSFVIVQYDSKFPQLRSSSVRL